MSLSTPLRRLGAGLCLALLTASAAAQSSTEELQRQVTALQEELARLGLLGVVLVERLAVAADGHAVGDAVDLRSRRGQAV